ncbi:toxic anion resistance protein [Paenibacillus thalictri]|uniref:Toxic anion resistance protein n=1 Tax=Paenibacillus thalictri TaxID=2527873 RepID=A0A4Q9DUC6_9BACL|nr:toxic anion resistance protein [Paenibacillus thalictri]TBL79845.1 toxic anion resistance protein [Paenibacillus thalictri]
MSFSMEIASPEELKQVVEEQIKPVPEEVRKIQEQAKNNVDSIMSMDFDALDRRREVMSTVEKFGMSTMKASTEKNSLMQITLGQLSKTGDEGSVIATGLAELQAQLKDLDPSLIDFTKTGFLGKFFNPLRAYFQRYEKADAVIAGVIETLNKGRITLKNDNTTLEIEQQKLRDLTKKLVKEIQLATFMDESLEKEIAEAKLRGDDADRIRFISEEVLFPLRQRVMDMQAMLATNQQGFISFELVMRNNKELIRGVDRTNTVTVAALRNAVIVAGALYRQNVVLKQITATQQATDSLIAGTSKMLKDQGAAIYKQAVESTVSVETLKQSFADSFAALDAISNYKQEALPKLRETINQFSQLSDMAEQAIQRLEGGSKLSF